MDILFVATELAPYARVGGLADVVAALTKTLRQHGHNVTLALPRFPHFERAGLLVARRLNALTVDASPSPIAVTVYDGRLPSGVDINLLDVPGFYDRDGIYGDAERDFADNPERFSLFCRAAAELVRQRARSGAPFEVVHAHDWPAALVPLFLHRASAAGEPQIACVFTVHNLAHQGIVDPDRLDALGIPRDLFNPEGVEFYGRVNLLKAGLLFADAITTVSRTYASEIRSPELGRGLDGVLAARADRLTGVNNAIDYAIWNPATDPHIAARFDAEDASPKGLCKTTLLTQCGLEMNPGRPVVALVGRLAERKGADLLLQSLGKLFLSDVSVIVAGDGEEPITRLFDSAAARFPGRFAFLRAPSDPVLHQVIAGADMLLAPSRVEPGGVTQLCAQRYGTVPVAHAVGALVDTIVDCDASLTTGTGFLFDEPTPAGLLAGTQRALAAFMTPAWAKLRRRIMRADLSWDRPAHQYAQLYRSVRRA